MIGQRVDDRYRVLRGIGRGDGADVYEAEDERLERRVALHLLDDRADGAGLGPSSPDEVLDAGEHAGRTFLVLPLATPGLVAATGDGDDEPTEELEVVATSTDRTAVLPLPLVPDPDATTAPEPPADRTSEAVRSVAGALWARRALLLGVVAGILLVVLVGLSARNDGLDVPTESSVPVTVETTTTTTEAPTTTAAPASEQPAGEGNGQGKGKGKRDRDDD
jgi:hypothetical protein